MPVAQFVNSSELNEQLRDPVPGGPQPDCSEFVAANNSFVASGCPVKDGLARKLPLEGTAGIEKMTPMERYTMNNATKHVRRLRLEKLANMRKLCPRS